MIYNGIQVGLTSFGAAIGCEAGYPDAFTRISYFRDWIFTHTWVRKIWQKNGRKKERNKQTNKNVVSKTLQGFGDIIPLIVYK